MTAIPPRNLLLVITTFLNDFWVVEQDYEKALEWYTKAALKGHAHAEYALGYAYYEGYGVREGLR